MGGYDGVSEGCACGGGGGGGRVVVDRGKTIVNQLLV